MKDKLKTLIKKVLSEKYYPKLADLYVKSKYLLIRFQCPFCKRSFGHLLPAGYYLPVFKEQRIVGAGYRLDAVCPGCGSLDRERLVYLYLKLKTNVFRGRVRLLHVAPEKSLQNVLKALPNVTYVSTDLASVGVMVKMDLIRMAFPDNSFDVVICNHVLEHIHDDRQAMSEICRVVKPEGWAIIQVPISLALEKTYEDSEISLPEDREKAFGQEDHVRIYGRDYRDRLERAGFRVKLYSFFREFGWLGVHKYALLKDENLYVCSKRRHNHDN